MQRLTMLVTPDAQWLLPDSPEFLEALGDPTPDYDAVAFAVRNMGFVKFHLVENSIVEIELHPRIVEFPALLAVQQAILRSEVKLFRMKYFDDGWHSEITSSREHVIARLSELCTPLFELPATERFHVEPLDFSMVFEETNHLRPLAQKWRVAFGRFDPSVIQIAMNAGLLSRLVIVGVKPKDQEPIWRFIGNGHKWIGSEFQLSGVGERLENMPDKEYGAWVTGFYKNVAASGQPAYDLVTGSIQYEDEHGRPRRPHRYERLMLPWKTPSGEVFITMCSRPTGTSENSKSAASMADPRAMNEAISE